MTVPRTNRRTVPFRTLEELGAEMLQFHGGMGDPIYAAGSYYYSGKRHPSRAVEIAADKELTRLYDNPDPTWTKKDMAGLWRAVITMTRLLEFDPASRGASPRGRRDITLRRKRGPHWYRWLVNYRDRNGRIRQETVEATTHREALVAGQHVHPTGSDFTAIKFSTKPLRP